MCSSDLGLGLQMTGKGAPGPVRAEFVTGKMGYRREHGGGAGQLVAKAVGLQKTRAALHIVDATAGLGQDAFAKRFTNSAKSWEGCERLPTTRISPLLGLVVTLSSMRSSPLSLKAPMASAAMYDTPSAGASTTAKTGLPFSIRAILTVNSPFFLINSLVPSIGSTSQ